MCRALLPSDDEWMRRLAFLGTVAMSVAACTGGGHATSSAASPAPTACPQGIHRSGEADAKDIDHVLYGHVPRWLPAGFGLLTLYADHSAVWSDRRCREVELGVSGDGDLDPAVAAVGQWRVIADAANGCGNAVLGRGRCLDYQTKIDHHVITVQMMAVDRAEGDRIVRSIA